jgi:hypothetical protein
MLARDIVILVSLRELGNKFSSYDEFLDTVRSWDDENLHMLAPCFYVYALWISNSFPGKSVDYFRFAMDQLNSISSLEEWSSNPLTSWINIPAPLFLEFKKIWKFWAKCVENDSEWRKYLERYHKSKKNSPSVFDDEAALPTVEKILEKMKSNNSALREKLDLLPLHVQHQFVRDTCREGLDTLPLKKTFPDDVEFINKHDTAMPPRQWINAISFDYDMKHLRVNPSLMQHQKGNTFIPDAVPFGFLLYAETPEVKFSVLTNFQDVPAVRKLLKKPKATAFEISSVWLGKVGISLNQILSQGRLVMIAI